MKDTHRGLALFTALVFLFLLGPLFIIMATSFGDSSVLKFPPEGFSLRWYRNIFDVEMFMTTFKVTIVVALAGNLIALLIGVPAAYALSRFHFRGKGLLNSIFISPILIPGVVLGFTMLKYLVVQFQLPIYTSLLIGHIVLMLPFIIRVIASSLSNFDYAVEEASMSLGASRFKTFFTVVLPNIRSGLIAGVLLAFLESFNNVDISVFMTGPGVSTLPIQMLTYVENYFDPTIAAISVLLMVVTALLMFLIERLMGLSYFTKNN
ncbi:ABC transporter permease [Paenibacillus thiaminolyticus]|uniref:ABC transporter permease n=1 Tax=Paenibacillus thiaminolyticus TaxID=49283 RepID=A0AAP9J361_PANTH|nr:ABC transporter permease [Paenibacillus thiaminolyticus]MCY9534653.1 ABC transporter permease [Paenibacillus thiaminolyticus]MCY9603303.1 ABC transporter permease [Paenibacillus thiaminolyticus]MCY9609975.1 ABC transporter permease [Paenibacillus thiaminolyticus]MCY9615497.1 ABC transporter permease [Paenibacillus thiaminolyticus]MCY9617156.1 ABC transporter permease [Paenibacillus thiaminolyticus]